MSNYSKGIERRTSERLELTLPITFFNKKVKTKNVSAGGVYFEVITSNIENYSSGKEFMIGIEIANSILTLSERTVWLTGFGKIVRVDEIGTTNQNKKLGVAMKFCEKLKVYDKCYFIRNNAKSNFFDIPTTPSLPS